MELTFDSNNVATVENVTSTSVYVWASHWCHEDDFAKLDAAGVVTSDWELIQVPYVKLLDIQCYMSLIDGDRYQLFASNIDSYPLTNDRVEEIWANTIADLRDRGHLEESQEWKDFYYTTDLPF